MPQFPYGFRGQRWPYPQGELLCTGVLQLRFFKKEPLPGASVGKWEALSGQCLGYCGFFTVERLSRARTREVPTLGNCNFSQLPSTSGTTMKGCDIYVTTNLLPTTFLFYVSRLVTVCFGRGGGVGRGEGGPVREVSRYTVFVTVTIKLSCYRVRLNNFNNSVDFYVIPLFVVYCHRNTFCNILDNLAFNFLGYLLNNNVN